MTNDISIINHHANAVQYLFSLEEFSKELLKTDIEDEKDKIDWYEEDWAEIFYFGFENGQFEAQLFDLQAGLNLSNLFEFNEQAGQMKERASPDFFGCFNRLSLKLDSNITADNIINYLNEKRLKAITHLSELKNISYIEPEDYQKIRPFLFVLNNSVAINVNTASAEVLSCLHPQLEPESSTSNIISARPYKNINNFHMKLQELTSLPLATIKSQFNTNFVDVKSNYFLLKSKITIDQLVLNTSSIFRRNASKINLVYRSYYLDN